MCSTLRQTYRHLVQQQIVRQIMLSHNMQRSEENSGIWEAGGIFALFSAAALCGTLAQTHLG